MLKEVPLRNVSGQQARREAAEEAAAADAANLSLNDACDEGGRDGAAAQGKYVRSPLRRARPARRP